jgi:hypothetical protein
MTADLVNRFAVTHGISKLRAMVVITELLGQQKSSTGMEPRKALDTAILSHSGW